MPDAKCIFVPTPKYLKEVNNAGDDVLSLHAASKQMFMPRYTMHGFNWHNQRGKEGLGLIRALRGLSTAHLPSMILPLMTTISHQMTREIASEEKINGVPHSAVYPMIQHIVAKLNSSIFFGHEASHDPVFLEAAVEYIEYVVRTAEVLRLLPNFLLPLVGKILSSRDKTQEKVFHVLYSIVEQRLEAKSMESTFHPNADRPNDCVQWIIDYTSPKTNPWSAERIVHEVMALWFGALHALSMSLTYATFDLCVHSEYVEPLRQELEGPEYLKFLETAQGLPLLDSFIKESARLTPFEAVSVRRRALKKFVFSDGTCVEKDDWTLTPLQAINHDEKIYPRAMEFNGFRFANVKSENGNAVVQPQGPSKFVDPSETWHFWGSGKVTCPGRFYSTVVIKLIMSHILLNYDIELADKEASRSWIWRTTRTPRADAKVVFRPRSKQTL
ncbi:MAG: hypothetical protein M1816_002087 [Peltula sp. TS41687]|nr:MAG: hypothetical protein M1816_002087 [Peltula sp. TS41687]